MADYAAEKAQCEMRLPSCCTCDQYLEMEWAKDFSDFSETKNAKHRTLTGLS